MLQDPISKITKAKRASGVAQVIEHLPSEHEGLTLSTTKVKKERWGKVLCALWNGMKQSPS
jgi:hypothetical protein